MRNPTIEFAVEPSLRTEVELYAKARGFKDAGAIARFALVQYMRRYPLKNDEIGALKLFGVKNIEEGRADVKAVQPEPV